MQWIQYAKSTNFFAKIQYLKGIYSTYMNDIYKKISLDSILHFRKCGPSLALIFLT